MSLLMKALEKAAQDRENTPAKPGASATHVAHAAHAAHGQNALSLEPLASAPPANPPAVNGPADGPRRNIAQARAAVMLNTPPARASNNAAAWISTHPVPFTAALAGVFVVGYGIYLYLQIAHPGLFIPARAPVVAAKATPPTSAPPAAAPPAPAAADSPLIPAQSVFGGAPAAPAATATTTAAATVSPPAAAPALPATPAPQNRIAISRGDAAAPRVNTAVGEAYAALESGRFDAARRLYEQALRGEPHNIDAHLGLAAIAQHENRIDDASRHFLAVLHAEPRHALAQTGLIALAGRADPQAAETRLKQLAAREPSPPLFFTLGNLYADQAQWAQAQQAYFQAHHLEPGNPDYAYNLAVALEHLGQHKLALGFYRRALQLASGRGRANFNSTQAQARIALLAARLE